MLATELLYQNLDAIMAWVSRDSNQAHRYALAGTIPHAWIDSSSLSYCERKVHGSDWCSFAAWPSLMRSSLQYDSVVSSDRDELGASIIEVEFLPERSCINQASSSTKRDLPGHSFPVKEKDSAKT